MFDISKFEPFLTFDVRNAIVAHMNDDKPNESCGTITLSDGVYEYHRHRNEHPEPDNNFRFAKTVAARIHSSAEVIAYVHSHPGGNIHPSKRDMEIQIEVDKPSVISVVDEETGSVMVFSFGDHLLDAPLYGRPFHYGVFDCLEAVRAEAWQREGRYMPPIARHNNWWKTDNPEIPDEDRDMYEVNFRNYGYEEFTPSYNDPISPWHPQVGDVILMQIGSPIAINHAAVYVGDNLIYQHRSQRQSGRTPLGYMMDTGVIRKWVRYTGKKS